MFNKPPLSMRITNRIINWYQLIIIKQMIDHFVIIFDFTCRRTSAMACPSEVDAGAWQLSRDKQAQWRSNTPRRSLKPRWFPQKQLNGWGNHGESLPPNSTLDFWDYSLAPFIWAVGPLQEKRGHSTLWKLSNCWSWFSVLVTICCLGPTPPVQCRQSQAFQVTSQPRTGDARKDHICGPC